MAIIIIKMDRRGVMSNLRPANRKLVLYNREFCVLLYGGVGACGVYNCKIANSKNRGQMDRMTFMS